MIFFVHSQDINKLENIGKKEYVYQPPLQSDDDEDSISRKALNGRNNPYKYDRFMESRDFPDYQEDGDVLGNRYQSVDDIYNDLYQQKSKLKHRHKDNQNQYHEHMKRNANIYNHAKNIYTKDMFRKRRHVGPHDNEGLQRLLSTGTLAPTTLPTNHPKYNQSIDFIFGTYWFFPADTQAILPEDKECISEKLSQEKIRFSPRSEYITALII